MVNRRLTSRIRSNMENEGEPAESKALMTEKINSARYKYFIINVIYLQQDQELNFVALFQQIYTLLFCLHSFYLLTIMNISEQYFHIFSKFVYGDGQMTGACSSNVHG